MTITEIDIPPTREEWLAARKPYANASDAAVYMGCHPFKSLEDLAVEKLAVTPLDVTNRAMDRGNRLEAAIADWWADEHGVGIYQPKVMYACGRLLATLDRRIVGNDREAVEAKSTSKRVTEPEPYWFWQVQAQMVCADLDVVHLAVLDGSMDLTSYTVERDNLAIAELLARVEEVWGYFDLGMVPEGVQFTSEHVARLHPDPEPIAVEAPEDVVARWLDAKDALKEAEQYEKSCRDELCNVIGEAEAAAVNGVPLVTWKSQVRTSLDVKSLLADHPELRKYERTTSYRVLRRVG